MNKLIFAAIVSLSVSSVSAAEYKLTPEEVALEKD